MAAKARAASSRGATPKHEPPQRKRLVLPDPKKVIKPSEERVTALSKALDQYREVIVPPMEIVTNAKAKLTLVDAAVPATASSPSSQDDRHKLDLWLKQREIVGMTSIARTEGVRKVKLSNGETLEVGKRVDPVDKELSVSRLRPSVYHYYYDSQLRLTRVWCDAHPYNVGPDGVGTPSGSVCWIGETQKDNPEAWRKAKQTALERTASSVRRRSKRNETQDTVNLNAAQYNRLLAPIPTLLQMVNNPREDFGVRSIYPTGEARRVYGLQTARHARLSRWWELAIQRAEGGGPGKDDEENPFLNGTMNLNGLTAGEWHRKRITDSVDAKKVEVQVPWIEAPPKVETTASVSEPPFKKGGYAALVNALEYVRTADAETVIKDYVLNPGFQQKALADVRWYLDQLPPESKPVEKKIESRLDKPHKLGRKARQKLKRKQQMQAQQENATEVLVTVKVDSASATSMAGGVKKDDPRVVIVELPPATAPVQIEEPASKPVDVQQPIHSGRVESMSQVELDEYRQWAEDDSTEMQVYVEAFPKAGNDGAYEQWDGHVPYSQVKAALRYLDESKPLPKLGMPVMSMPRPVAANDEDNKPFDPIVDIEDPDYDHKIMVMINAEQEMLMDLHDLEMDTKARLRSYEWAKAMWEQGHAKTAAERQAATGTILRLHARDARNRDVDGQEVVAGLLLRPKVPPRMIWSDIWQSDLLREDPAVIREGLRAKWKRLSTYQNKFYAKAHRRDVRVTEAWVGKSVGWSTPDRKGWKVCGPVFDDVEVFRVHSLGAKTEVLLKVSKIALLHRRKMGDRAKKNLRMELRRAAVGCGPVSRFTQWALDIGDVSHGYAQAKTKKQLVVDSGMRTHLIYADLKAEDYGPLNRKGETYRPVIRTQSQSDRRVLTEATMLDQILLGIVNYFKDEPRPLPVVSRKQAQTELKLRLQEQRANPRKYPKYLQYRPTQAFSEWIQLRANGDESKALQRWLKNKPLVETHGSSTYALRVIEQRQVPREPVVVATTTEPTQSQRPFVMTPDSNFASIIADHTRALREAGIEISTNDLKKMGISGEKAKPPEYVIVDDVLYERAKRPAHR